LRVPHLPCTSSTAPAAGGGSGSEGAVSPVHYLLQNRPLKTECRIVGVWETPFPKAKKKKNKTKQNTQGTECQDTKQTHTDFWHMKLSGNLGIMILENFSQRKS
jgi:hypothetical protein